MTIRSCGDEEEPPDAFAGVRSEGGVIAARIEGGVIAARIEEGVIAARVEEGVIAARVEGGVIAARIEEGKETHKPERFPRTGGDGPKQRGRYWFVD